MDELKQRAAQLQDKLAGQHAEFSGSGVKQADPAAAAAWEHQWQQQAREISGVHEMLKQDKVGVDTHSTLASAERAAGQLEQQLQEIKGEAAGSGQK